VSKTEGSEEPAQSLENLTFSMVGAEFQVGKLGPENQSVIFKANSQVPAPVVAKLHVAGALATFEKGGEFT
jgi:hypothetical protein